MSYVLTTEWDKIQERNIDPLSPVDSDNHNKLLKVLGSPNMYIKGLDYSFIYDNDNKRIVMQLTPGIVVINYVCIEFKEISTIIFLSEEDKLYNTSYYVVVEYEYRKIKPLSVARIKTIEKSLYDPNKHLILYSFHTGYWYSLPDEETFNTWLENETNFKDSRINRDLLPTWLTKSFLSSEGGEMETTFLVPTPTSYNEVANKGYVDDLIANHDDVHTDKFLQLTGGSLSGTLYLNEHPDPSTIDSMTNKQAATKGYVDYWADYFLGVMGGGPYLPLYGGTMTGFITLHSRPIENMHAANKEYVDNRIEEVINFSDGPFLPLSGGTMKGHIVLYANPTNDYHPATKLYVDNVAAPKSHNHDATDITSGYINGDRGVEAGQSISSFVKYVALNSSIGGTFYGGSQNPSSNRRLNYNGYFYATKTYNAVYNDFADCLNPTENLTYDDAKNKIVEIVDNSTVGLATKESTKVIGIVSSSYAYVAGGTEEEIKGNKKLPICAAGYVWVDVVNVEEANLADYVIPYDNGFGMVIPNNKREEYKHCIVGKIIDINKDENQVRVSIMIS